MVRTGSPVVDRLIEATNDHDVEAMMECFHQDYRSGQPLHPDVGFTAMRYGRSFASTGARWIAPPSSTGG
jgi:hypothetical protein